IRPFRAVMMPLDRAPQRHDIERFIPRAASELDWVRNARSRYAFDMSTALRGALADLRLERGRIGFDDLALARRLDIEAVDAYDTLMHARAVKTATEIALLRRSTALNRAAIERTVKSWEKGMRWRELNRAYHAAVVELGGFVRDPGAMVWGHPRGGEAALTLQTGLEDFEVERGLHVMFDCHGTLDLYCWDGGRASFRAAGASSIARRGWPTPTPRWCSSTGSASRTWTSSKRPPTGASRPVWWCRCTWCIPGANRAGRGSRRSCSSPSRAASRSSAGVTSRCSHECSGAGERLGRASHAWIWTGWREDRAGKARGCRPARGAEAALPGRRGGLPRDRGPSAGRDCRW